MITVSSDLYDGTDTPFMTFIDLANERYSSRKYLDTPVENEKIESILEAGRMSPTAKNLQPARVIVAESQEALAKLGKTARLYGAPLGLVVVVDVEKAWVRPFDGKNFGDIDASIVVTQMMYRAQELGLGSVWIGYFDPVILKEELGLKDNEEVSAILAVGYKDDDTSANHGNRMPASEFSERI